MELASTRLKSVHIMYHKPSHGVNRSYSSKFGDHSDLAYRDGDSLTLVGLKDLIMDLTPH